MELFSINKGAEFSDCGKYRYALWRIWDDSKPIVMFIGLNPSTADSEEDDPTIESVARISKHNGYGGFYMMNLFGIISSKSEILKQVADAQGDNLKWHREIIDRCKDVVFAWGNFKEAVEVSKDFISGYPKALCIKKNKNGSPVHPLYQKETSILKPFNENI